MPARRTYMRLLLGASFLITGWVYADPLDEAVRAYASGDFERSITLLQPLQARGVAEAQYLLGRIYEQGDGLARDQRKAMEFYRAAAEQGHGEARQRVEILEQSDAQESVVVEWYLPAARDGDTEAQYHLGYMYETGWGVPVDESEAWRWYREAAMQDHDMAQLRLGMMKIVGIGGQVNFEEGADLIRRAAAAGNRLAEALVQELLDAPDVEKLNVLRIVRGLRRSIDEDEGKAVRVLQASLEDARGRLTRDGGKPRRESRETVAQVAPAARKSEQKASAPTVAPSESTRRNAEQSRREAASRREQQQRQDRQLAAAEALATAPEPVIRQEAPPTVSPQGAMEASVSRSQSSAQFSLGNAFDLGLGVARDDKESAKWYLAAARQGNADAQYALGIFYVQGRGVVQDEHEGLRWFRAAAEQGHDMAQVYLQLWNNETPTALLNNSVAIGWLKGQGRQWNLDALYRLGFLFETGRGVQASANQAMQWYRLAANQGHHQARRRLALLQSGGAPVAEALGSHVQMAKAGAGSNNGMIMLFAAALLLMGTAWFLRNQGIHLRKLTLALPGFRVGNLASRLETRSIADEDIEFIQALWSNGPQHLKFNEDELLASEPVREVSRKRAADADTPPTAASPATAPEPAPASSPATATEPAVASAVVPAESAPAATQPPAESAPAERPAAVAEPEASAAPPAAEEVRIARPRSKAGEKGSGRPSLAGGADRVLKAADLQITGGISRDSLSAGRVRADQLFGDGGIGYQRAGAQAAQSAPTSLPGLSSSVFSGESLSRDDITTTPARYEPPLLQKGISEKPAVEARSTAGSGDELELTQSESRSLAQVHLNIGRMFHSGDGVPQNAELALKWFRRAAEAGLAEAQYELALRYLNGDGVDEDETEARKWLQRAAESGFALAEELLQQQLKA